jgi:hypothetical protein
MIIVGLGLAWVAYAAGIYGYCLVRGYNVGFTQLFKPVWPGNSGAAQAPFTPGPVPGPPGPGGPVTNL